ncbi:zinc-alpha-2-glycoprotein-like [Gracilinanus agilis]|uniref:zinc-alpha-2-glycoprotein-like n=1 Tax=Gracilinanus agilis TaxID=191870 RepID=UPI001CFD65FA|nr:zinc-alpha-2-glycoprotein-like [Gracilinanus agilis]
MGTLVIDIFLLLLSGTIMSQKPRKRCDSLQYTDIATSDSATGYSEFLNEAFFNNQQVYIYDNDHQRAIPQTRWQNVENWADVTKLQKEREKLIMKDFQKLIKSNPGIRGVRVFSQTIGCELCPKRTFRIAWYFDTMDFRNISTHVKYQDTQDSVGKMNQDPSAETLPNEYLEKHCFETLQKYRNYQNAH